MSLTSYPPISSLGKRIMILGPSNSGKSTFAHGLGVKTHLPVVHLDQLFHLPNQRWVPRPKAEFTALLSQAISEPTWIMDGNYTGTNFRERLQRSTGVIILSIDRGRALARYFRRCFTTQRYGTVHNKIDYPTWEMIRFILHTKQRPDLIARLANAAGVSQVVTCHSPEELERLSSQWELSL